ncbi:MAG TPA: MoaD/ThiS family protein [Nitrospira sp.]|jgi:molybdopterin synthase sulfur carrier subunit
MRIHIPSALRSYTKHQSEVEVEGSTLGEVLFALDGRYPGFRFRIVTEQDRIRPHIRIFVNDEQAQELQSPLRHEDRVYIVCALSGG